MSIVSTPRFQGKGSRTISFLPTRCLSLAHFSLLFQIYMPTIRLSLVILQCERKNGIALFYGVFALRGIGLEGAVNGVKGGGGRK